MMRADAQLELARTFLEAKDLRGQCRSSLDERGVIGTRLSGLCTERSGCVARILERPLRVTQALSGTVLFTLEADD